MYDLSLTSFRNEKFSDESFTENQNTNVVVSIFFF
jgi:hypothetical protein